MLKGFRDFILRGNVVDLAVAVIIGAAFGKIITCLHHQTSSVPLIGCHCGQAGLLLSRLHPARRPDRIRQLFNRASSTSSFVSSMIYFLLVLPVNYLLTKSGSPWRRPPRPAPSASRRFHLPARRCKFCAQPVV